MYLREARVPHAINAVHSGFEEGVDVDHDPNPATDAMVHAINSCVEINKTVSIENLKPRSRSYL